MIIVDLCPEIDCEVFELGGCTPAIVCVCSPGLVASRVNGRSVAIRIRYEVGVGMCLAFDDVVAHLAVLRVGRNDLRGLCDVIGSFDGTFRLLSILHLRSCR